MNMNTIVSNKKVDATLKCTVWWYLDFLSDLCTRQWRQSNLILSNKAILIAVRICKKNLYFISTFKFTFHTLLISVVIE